MCIAQITVTHGINQNNSRLIRGVASIRWHSIPSAAESSSVPMAPIPQQRHPEFDFLVGIVRPDIVAPDHSLHSIKRRSYIQAKIKEFLRM